MYPLSNGTTFLVQQSTAASPGTSVFDGTDYGRSSVLLFGGGPANGRITVRAKRYGTESNSFLITLINPGANFPATVASLNGVMIEVRLRTSSGSVVATAKEVADAINAVPSYAFPVVADYDRTTAGNGVVSVLSATALSGGVAARVEAGGLQFKWDIPLNVNAGRFYFEQNVPMVVRQMGASFPTIAGPTLFKVWIVNMTPGLGIYPTEKVPLFERMLDTAGAGDIGFTDGRSPLLPNQCLVVECPLPGIVNFHLRPDSRMPYP